ncbi:cytochrome [Sesamum angolense]|uniref:Cytochrome n=1 Tax=Sesamum angolense TaxID=2727404 RepID=A0AAE1WBX4_9LAMI|nr:cytochrome [Sesamum angolense]
MDLTASFLLLCLIWACFHLLNSNSRRRRSAKLPPGPYPFPIIGNILHFGPNPHQTVTKLSKIYGPLMHLRLGSIDTIVASSPEMAKEILQTHHQAFPLRSNTAATRAFDHHATSVAFLPIGDQWRNLRKICKEHMFSNQRLQANEGLRQEKLQKLVQYIQECCVNGRTVDIGHAAVVTSLNLMSNTVLSVDSADYNTCQELEDIICRCMRVWGSPNLGDYFGFLGLFDPQGIKREAEFCVGKLLAMFDSIIDQRVEASRNSQARKTDLLEVLLEISDGNQAELTRNEMKHLFVDLFVAGVDTTSGTVEWVMTELLRNPHVMSKLKTEVRTVLGANKQIEESDISKLPYLQAVIKEAFRYHPSGPFITRVKDGNDLQIKKYVIPKNALILINIWATGRDPSIWPNPDSFEPERFLDTEIDVKGHHFELLPFGAGRRICPGMPLAYRMVHLIVASLVQNFDWKLEPGVAPEDVDLSEKLGISLHKAIPLKAVPTKP